MTAIARPPATPTLCPEIPQADLSDWKSIQKSFRHAPEWKFDQSWADRRERGFRGGKVRIGWRGDRMCYFADLSDREVVTRARRRNEKMWELGDVLEVFTGFHDRPAYIEYHTAPNGLILQLFWPNSEALNAASGPAGLAPFIREDDAAVSVVRRTRSGWQVYGEIPEQSLGGRKSKPGSLAGQVWDLSFSRYDYPDGEGRPVLSSTSPLTKAAYHRRHEWRQVQFVEERHPAQ